MSTVILNFKKGFAPLHEAFENCGYSVIENCWRPTHQQLDDCKAVVINLYEGARAPMNATRLYMSAKKAGVPVVGIDRDAPWHMGLRRRRLAFFRLLRPLDIYATHTLQPTWRFAPVVHYHANAVWASQFNLHGQSLADMRNEDFYRYDVSFVGNMDGKRYKEHADRQRFFEALKPRLEALGLRVLFRTSGGMTEQEQIDVIQRSKINLSYRSSCDHGGIMSWGLPERCYGVPARGGFLLTDTREHAKDDFDLRSEWAGYTDFEDCITQIQYWLAHFEQARDVAEAAHRRVMGQHTYEDRVRKLMDVVEQVHKRG